MVILVVSTTSQKFTNTKDELITDSVIFLASDTPIAGELNGSLLHGTTQ